MSFQFFDKAKFIEFFGELDFASITLFSTDTYDEQKLSESIEKVGKEFLLAISLQLAIVGYGNKKFNKVILNGKDIDIEDFFNINEIKYKLSLNSKLIPKDLTPRRLIRFFRFATQEYLEKVVNVQTYLYKKYCIDKSENARKIVFPGYEHLAEPARDEENVKILIRTYKQLDSRCKINVTERIIRVLSARGFSYEFLINIKI